MITQPQNITAEPPDLPTVWGLTPVQLHDRFWAARGVQVVRLGEQPELVSDAELFLLTDPRSLVFFRLRNLVDTLSWLKPDVLWVRLRDDRERGYREMAVSDDQGNFLRFQRAYGGSDSRLARVALTPYSHIAHMWQAMPDPRTGWRQLRRQTPRELSWTTPLPGRVYDRQSPSEVMDFTRHLIQHWPRPDATVDRARRVSPGVWRDTDTPVERSAKFVGPVWVGAGRSISPSNSVVGPAVLWDDPDSRPAPAEVNWHELEPTAPLERPIRPRSHSSLYFAAKRCFDILFALLALSLVIWIFPFVMLAIFFEDGWPCFFAHRRETRGGREFNCLKFRSMRKDADQIKAQLAQLNQVDGPQFYIENDPRLTRVGKFIRRFHIDELPQFFNVLAGDMSIVGPRPSPFKENQYCPPWREARLSVRPGITGLWQVCRTREQGLDFQEWIRYDIEYVEHSSFSLDLWIIWRTIVQNLRK